MKLKLNLKFSKRFSADFFREVLDLLVEASYLAVIFLVPLWFAYLFPTYNIFEFNKLIVFKILVWLLFLFTSLKIVFFHSHLNFPFRYFFKKYWLWPAVFIVGLGAALLFSDNPLLSFYGTIERQGGLVSYLYYFFWFVLVSFNLLTVNNHLPQEADSKGKKIRRAVITAAMSATLVSVYGILQILNIDFISWPEAPFLTYRAFSTFGQPNFLASWLLLVMPLSLYLGYSSRRFLIRFLYFLCAVIQLACLIMTGSRSGLLALLFASGLYLAYLFFTAAWTRRRKALIGSFFVLISVISLLSVNKVWPGRISDIFDYQSGSVAARVNFYFSAADSIKSRPLFGYGLESGNEVFIKYYEPDWAVYGDVGQSADRAHNLVFDILLTVGAWGLALFLVFYYFFFALAGNNMKARKDPRLSSALALGAAAYLFSLLFGFAIVAGEIYFWFFLALLAVLNHGVDETAGKSGLMVFIGGLCRSGRSRLIMKIIMAIVLAALSFWQISRSFRTLAADYYFNKIYFTLARLDYFTALTLDSYLREQRTNPINQMAYDSFWGEKLSEFYPTIDELAVKKVVGDKMKEVEASLPAEGYKNLLVKAKINNALGDQTLAQIYLDKVIELAPHWPLAYLERGKASFNQEDFKRALIAYNLALLNLPSADDSRLNDPHRDLVRRYQYFIYSRIGAIYEQEKNYAAAEKYFRLAYQSDPSDFVLLKRMADMAYRLGNLKKAIEYTERGLMRNPTDFRWHVALAALYYENGNQTSAASHIEKALLLAPDNLEIIGLKKTYGK